MDHRKRTSLWGYLVSLLLSSHGLEAEGPGVHHGADGEEVGSARAAPAVVAEYPNLAHEGLASHLPLKSNSHHIEWRWHGEHGAVVISAMMHAACWFR
jgi:hypothetical protein